MFVAVATAVMVGLRVPKVVDYVARKGLSLRSDTLLSLAEFFAVRSVTHEEAVRARNPTLTPYRRGQGECLSLQGAFPRSCLGWEETALLWAPTRVRPRTVRPGSASVCAPSSAAST